MFVITGGGTGIGRALAHELARRGKDVLVIGRREPKLKETAAFSPFIHVCCADISTLTGREHVVQYLAGLGPLAGMIHNAGVIEPITRVTDIQESSWNQILATNLGAPLFLTQCLLTQLKGARVLHVGSGAAYFPVKGWSAYCVSKAALAMLTRCWQLECGHETFFAHVMPGIIDTDMQTLIRHSQSMDVDKLEFFKSLFYEKQLVSPDTVAQFISWLLLSISSEEYVGKEWDIYDKDHHPYWLTTAYQTPMLPL